MEFIYSLPSFQIWLLFGEHPILDEIFTIVGAAILGIGIGLMIVSKLKRKVRR